MAADALCVRGSASAPPRRLRDSWLALAGLSVVFLFEMLDISGLTVALPTISRDLRASTTDLQWVIGAYSVVFGGLMLLFGAVADRFGRRRVMLIGLTLLALAGSATVLVSTPGELIAIRAVLGTATIIGTLVTRPPPWTTGVVRCGLRGLPRR